MLAISCAEFFATGSWSTRWFHGLLGGKIERARAPGSGWAETSPGTTASTGIAISAKHPSRTRWRRMESDFMWQSGGRSVLPPVVTRATAPERGAPQPQFRTRGDLPPLLVGARWHRPA